MSVHVYMCFYRFEMIDAARNKIRVKAAYVMMAATIGACMIMVFLGKRVRIMNESCMKLFFFLFSTPVTVNKDRHVITAIQ